MTREEAREIISFVIETKDKLKAVNTKANILMVSYKTFEAFAMALKALEQEPCEDCISRETARRIVDSGRTRQQMIDMILATPPVTPQSKTGHWISYRYGAYYECSNCKESNYRRDKYCPNCGAKMQEVDNGDK